ncbi:nuclear transcription factor Y subunit B-3 [Prunus avium]|uniref:Nuclear transcription factor Y subunit B-3 n=1 Tax=Prunus avium TaxID=42229 RepID=A0A6P5TM09_PRUAV|nr:nuclear transcription factor Y subunit B-3 [Prunus avium]
MKKGFPGKATPRFQKTRNAKISKDAKETAQECVSEFISFITGQASDKCRREKRKTINGDDLLWVMTTLGFKDYVEPLKIYLDKFREMEGERTAGTGMARQLLHADHHPHEYHDQRQREQLQHLHAPGMNMYGGMMIDGSSTSSSSSRSRASSLSLWIW